MKQKSKILMTLIAVVMLFAVLSFAMVACDGNGESTSGGGNKNDDVGTKVEEEKIKIVDIASEFVEETKFYDDVFEKLHECELQAISKDRTLIKDAYHFTYDSGTLTAVYKFENAKGQTQLGSTYFELSDEVQKAYELDAPVDELLKATNLAARREEEVPLSTKNTYEDKLQIAANKFLSSVSVGGYVVKQTNDYSLDVSLSNSLKEQVLALLNNEMLDTTSANKPKLKDLTTLGEVRKDRTMVVTGLDEANDRLCQVVIKIDDEHAYLFPDGMTSSEAYSAYVEGHGQITSESEIDPRYAYNAPAVKEPEIVSVSEIFDKVFEGFNLPALSELLNEIAHEWISQYDYDIFLLEFDDEKTVAKVYTEHIDRFGCPHLVTLNLTGDIVESISNYQKLKGFSELERELLKKYGEEPVEKDSIKEAQIIQDMTLERKKYEATLKTIKDFDGSKIKYTPIITGGQTQLDNINQYGEKLLQGYFVTDDLQQAGVKVLRTYLTDWGGKGHDIGGYFNTGYTRGADACVVYVENGQIKIYKTDIQVPHYIDSTNETLYRSILDGKYVALNIKITEIKDAIMFDIGEENNDTDNKNSTFINLYYDEERKLWN